jgi:cytidylate kinase
MNHHSHRSVAELVDAQVRAWEIESKRPPPIAAAPRPRPPCVTIARELGAGGGEIGIVLADALGFRVWDREIVHSIAEESGLRESLLATLDEHDRSSLGEFLATLSGRDEVAFAYASRLGAVLRTVAKHGKAVLIGRGAQVLVPRERALHLRVIAPLELRVKAVSARLDIDEAAAEDLVTRTDRDRRTFHMRHFGIDVADPSLYDVVINRSALSIAGAATIAAAAYHERFAETR